MPHYNSLASALLEVFFYPAINWAASNLLLAKKFQRTGFTIGTMVACPSNEDPVKIAELARAIDARLIVPVGSDDPEIRRIFGAPAMSDLIANAAADTLLITPLNNSQLIRVADLMDAPGICLVDGQEPVAGLVERASSTGTALLVSRADFISTCARAAECVSAGKAAAG